MAMFNHLEKTKKQKNPENLKMSSSMPVQSGLSITLVGHLSQFFQKNHMYKAVYARIVVSTKDLVELWSFFFFLFLLLIYTTQKLQLNYYRLLFLEFFIPCTLQLSNLFPIYFTSSTPTYILRDLSLLPLISP